MSQGSTGSGPSTSWSGQHRPIVITWWLLAWSWRRLSFALVSRAWHQIAGLFGYRLRPELAASFETLATLLNATMRGLIVTALSTPEVATRMTVASPFGTPGKEPWSLPATGMASIAMAFLEPEPAAEWNEQRLAEIHRALDAWVTLDQ